MQIFTSQSIELLTPVEGEIIFSGSRYTIRWDSAPHVVTFNLLLSLDQGTTWTAIPGAQGITGASFDWSVPRPAGNKKKCLIKVTGFNAKGKKVGTHRSAAPFMIEVVKLTAPNGEETLFPDQMQPITWETHETKRIVAEVRIYHTRDGGRTWSLIDVVSNNPGRYDNWIVPPVARTKQKCKVKVVLIDDRGHALGVDTSDTFFVIEGT
jgi:hypothetical protein